MPREGLSKCHRRAALCLRHTFLVLAREDPALECEYPTRPLTQRMISPNLRLEDR